MQKDYLQIIPPLGERCRAKCFYVCLAVVVGEIAICIQQHHHRDGGDVELLSQCLNTALIGEGNGQPRHARVVIVELSLLAVARNQDYFCELFGSIHFIVKRQ